MRPRLDSLCRAVSSMGQQDSLILEVFKEASFLTQLVCGSAGIAVPALVVIAKLLQRLDLAMTRATATDVSYYPVLSWPIMTANSGCSAMANILQDFVVVANVCTAMIVLKLC